jgi:DhnA family fructose-bisphosphate aldolase class Ia
MLGKSHRMSRIFDQRSGRTIIVPIDDSLIAGPQGGLLDLRAKVTQIANGRPNAVLGFPGHFEQYTELLNKTAWICNLTASTTRSTHTRKVQILSVREAVTLGVDCVAAHVNVTSRFEGDMIATLGHIIADARRYGMPVAAIMYPRRERADGCDDNYEELKRAESSKYAELVSHCVRIAKDLGADIIKTQYTGSTASFQMVAKAAQPIPVVIAGGPLIGKESALAMACDSLRAGASGVSFGRNIFDRPDTTAMIRSLRSVIKSGSLPEHSG